MHPRVQSNAAKVGAVGVLRRRGCFGRGGPAALSVSLLLVLAPAAVSAQDTLATVLDQLNTTTNEVVALRASLSTLHHSLWTAEAAVVSGTQNITNARAGLFTIEHTAQLNNRTFARLMRRGTAMNASLGLDNTTLNLTRVQILDVSNASAVVANVSNSSARPEDLARLEELTHRIWQAADPTNPQGLDDAERRADADQEAVEALQQNLTGMIQAQLVKRLRRGTGMMSRALARLARAGAGEHEEEDEEEEEASGTEEDRPLGAMLGLVPRPRHRRSHRR